MYMFIYLLIITTKEEYLINFTKNDEKFAKTILESLYIAEENSNI